MRRAGRLVYVETAIKEAAMNTYGLEKVTRAHIEQMHRDTRDAHLLRAAGQPAAAAASGRYMALAGLSLMVILVAFLLISAGL